MFLSGASIAQGALIAAIALGIVLTFRGSGVVNLAYGGGDVRRVRLHDPPVGRGPVPPPLPNPLALVEGVVHLVPAGRRPRPAGHPPGSVSFRPQHEVPGRRSS